MALPTNLATNDIIDELWTDAVVAELIDLAVPSSRYPAKPSAGVVYGVTLYDAVVAATTAVPQSVATVFATIAMPAAPAGSKLDMSITALVNSVTGHGGGFMWFRVNGVVASPPIVLADDTSLRSYSGRCNNVTPPTGVPYNIELTAAKNGAGGTLNINGANNSHLSVVSYRP